MEERRIELEFDEFEKLLGEIPNATSGNPTSGNPHSEGPDRKRVYLNESLSPVCVNSYKEPSSEKLQNKGRLDEGKNLLNKIQQSPTKGVQPEEMNLPDDQSLTSAFAGLNFNNGMPTSAGVPPLAKPLQNYSSSLDGRFPNNLKKQNSEMDSMVMVVPSFRPPNNVPYGLYGFDMTKVGHESTNLSILNPQELRRRQVANCQPIDNFSAAVPLDHSMTGFPFLSNVPVPGMQFPVMSDQQQFFLEAQAQLPYLHPQQINQHQISWRNIEEEQHYNVNQRYLRLQQLHSQRLEGQRLVQENGNVPNRLISRSSRQPHFEVPVSLQCEQFKTEPFWNSYDMTRGSNQSNPAFSSVECNATKAWEKVGKQSYPEKILTRSHGLNTLNAVRFGSVGANDLLTHVGQHGKVLPNGCFSHNLSNAGCYHLDNMILYPNTTDLKSADLKLLPQKYNSLDEVTGRIFLMAKDQHGCRFLQRKFSEGTKNEVEMIFAEIIEHIVELMTDPFGNYLVQKLLEVCDEDQRMQIIHSVTSKSGELLRISCDMHGTRAVQKVIETLKTPEQFSMVVSSLRSDTVTLIKNMNGNHVAQRCLQYLVPEHSEFLFEAAIMNCVELATDRHGCCVLQKCLSHSDGERRHRLICEIASNAIILSQDPFGNYVVQYVFELGLPWAIANILNQLNGSYGDLSVQKHSSNVVEKCLKCAGEERRTRIIQELIDNPRLDQIMQDPFGNYVIQAALEQSKGSLHAKLVDAIKPHVSVLRTSPYGKKVLSNQSLKRQFMG
ncbi:Coatomer beta subunit [Trema orientale]|uniref:Coatomer beta subunit n=1 Tax=Trema orientale TaxID=63057 RepID=A0A2P5FCY7_TREOI|nr:Coatomer beta subunit [Trema orientale]